MRIFFEFAKSYYEIYGSKVINKNDCFAVFDENENTADVFTRLIKYKRTFRTFA